MVCKIGNHEFLEHFRAGSDKPAAYVCRTCGFYLGVAGLDTATGKDTAEGLGILVEPDALDLLMPAEVQTIPGAEPEDVFRKGRPVSRSLVQDLAQRRSASDLAAAVGRHDLAARAMDQTYEEWLKVNSVPSWVLDTPNSVPLDFDSSGARTGQFSGKTETEEPTAMELSKQNQKSSSGRWWGRSTIYGKEDEHTTPYMTRYWIGRLRLHIFYRGDQDPDGHSHPWNFWTFPLTPYVEEVFVDEGEVFAGFTPHGLRRPNVPDGQHSFDKFLNIVPAFRFTRRPATHTHRVIGRYAGYRLYVGGFDRGFRRGHPQRRSIAEHFEPQTDDRRIITLVWRSKEFREWGFLKNRDGKWCWVAWKEYVFGDGKSAPCE